MSHHPHPPADSRTMTIVAGVTAIASAYVYFLLFAEFAFIGNIRDLAEGTKITPLMVALGLSGIGGSLGSAFCFDEDRSTRQLVIGFAGCALAAGLSLLSHNPIFAIGSAVLVGGSLSWTTVILALCLRPSLHLKRLGTYCGLGTGLAYAFCNQPLVFNATPHTQTNIAIFAALLGLVVSFRLKGTPTKHSTSLDYSRLLVGLWVLLFLGLVWLDSSAFFIIQNSPELKAATWDGVITLQGNAFVHLCAAVVAGVALDRRQLPLTLGFALVALLGACLLLGGSSQQFPAARVAYTAGVSIYSTALIFYPARGGRTWIAGLIFAVSGWLGSAGGLGMAQSLHALPSLLVIIVASVAAVVFFVRHYWLKHERLERPIGPSPADA